MDEKNFTGLIPENIEGKEVTAQAGAKFENAAEAQTFYEKAKMKFLFIHNWKKIVGTLSADFQLTDSNGNEVDRDVRPGDHFRIDIPGPGSQAGDGYDWALVEEVKEVHRENIDSIAIRVRPAANPTSENSATAHFFSEKSSSTFVLTREGNEVTASIYDRNIEANEETKEPFDKVRNAIVGLTAKHGVSKLQWQALAEALVKKDNS